MPGIADSVESITGWQEELHRHPELSMQETRTGGLIAERLEAFGYAVQRIGGGVVGILTNGPGPTVLFRADIDGLPVRESTGLAYTATDPDGNTVPVMHACGHDLHITAALGAAALLAEGRERWAGTYVALSTR